MAINSNFRLPISHDLTANRLTKGVAGDGKTMEVVSQHLAAEAQDTVGILGGNMGTQMTQDLRKIVAAVGNQEARAGVGAQQRMGFQSALMAAGALLGQNGVFVPQMADQLHQVTQNTESLNKFADQIREVPSKKPGDHPLADASFSSLAVKVGAHSKNNPVAMFMGGAFLSAEQGAGTLLESARERAVQQDNGYFFA